MNIFQKKLILSVLLHITFFVAWFGFFTEFALASPYNITNDVIAALNVGVGATSITQIDELPDGLTDGNRATITNNIVTNDLVQQVKNKVTTTNNALLISEAAKNQIAARCTVAGNTPCLPTDQSWAAALATYDEKNSLFTDAVTDLNSALAKARTIQDSPIKEMLSVSRTEAFTNNKATELAGPAQQAARGLSGQTVADSVGTQSQNVVFTKEQTEAAKNKLKNAAAFNAPDQLVMTLGAACSFFPPPFGSGVNILPCFAELFYNVIYRPVSMVLRGSGMIFDYMIMLSIDNKKNMVAPDFINEAWTVVRDFSNMLFIFVLLYTGIMTMFGMADWKKVVIKVVVVALLINFSLFFTKVVIDAGNVLAVGIMSAISVPAGTTGSLSAGLVAAFQPQQFLKLAAGADVGSSEAVNAIIVFLVATVVSGFAAYYLFKASLLFLGRLIGFWFLMIVSPFVFISTALPSGDKFKAWFDSLIGLTFAAPLFLFLMYLIMMIIQSGNGIMEDFKIGGDWSKAILGPVMVATLIIIALKKSLELTEKMAGDFGKLGADMANMAMTGAMGVSGIVARQTLGRGAGMLLKNTPVKTEEELARMSKFDRKIYEGGRGLITKVSKSSLDVRNFGDKNSLLSKTISGKVFQKEQGVGGREKVEKEAEKKATDNVPELSIFEKQGIRNRAQKDEDKKASDADLDLIRATQEEQTATEDLTAQLKASADAEKAHNESPEAKAKNEASAVYEEAVRERTRFGSTKNIEAVDKAKLAFEEAETAHSSSQAATQASAAFTKLESAKKASSEATEALEAATKNRDEISGTTKEGRDKKVIERRERAKSKSEDKIKSVNDYRREQHAKK